MGEVYLSEGKTIDEAIFNGLSKLGISIDEVDIDVVQNETRGVFGLGAKPAIVKLTVRDTIDVKELFENKPEKPEKSEIKESPQKQEFVARPETPAHIQQEERVNRPSDDNNFKYVHKNNQKYNSGYRNNKNQRFQKQPVQNVDSSIEYSEDCAKNSEAGKFLIELLEKMGLQATVLGGVSERGLHLKIDTDEPGAIIGHRGETLDALQYLVQLYANKDKAPSEYVRVSLDAQGYRVKREEVLKNLARAKAATVRASGKPYKFEPMSPYERRIIHSALQGNPYVTTHSEGDEPRRYVVLTAKHQQFRRRNHN